MEADDTCICNETYIYVYLQLARLTFSFYGFEKLVVDNTTNTNNRCRLYVHRV